MSNADAGGGGTERKFILVDKLPGNLHKLGNEFFRSCPVDNCYVTDDSGMLPNVTDFDAVLFHIPLMSQSNLTYQGRGRIP